MVLLIFLLCQQLESVPSSTNVLETRVVTMSSALGNLTLMTMANGIRGLKKNSVAFRGSKGFQSLIVTCFKDLSEDEDLLDTPFIMKTVLLAPLIGTIFEADLREVHQIIVASTTGTYAEQFLKSVAKYKCDLRDMNIIRAFYKGTGSNNRILLEAKQSLKHIHYKN